MSDDKKRLTLSLVFPGIFLLIIWIIKLAEIVFSFNLGFLGIYPLKPSGLIGILTSPLIHGDLSHLAANSAPVFVLGFIVFYFYKDIAWKILIMIYLITGLWVWFLARDGYHIGASGLIYGMASFIFFSGLIRRDTRLMAASLIVIFLYGSLVWGVFPDFFPDRNISWEGHLMGAVAGFVLAVFYRKEGPPKKKYEWELEEEEEEEIGEGRLEKGDWRREKGEGRLEKGEGRREIGEGEGRREIGEGEEREGEDDGDEVGRSAGRRLPVDSEKSKSGKVVYHYKPRKRED